MWLKILTLELFYWFKNDFFFFFATANDVIHSDSLLYTEMVCYTETTHCEMLSLINQKQLFNKAM